MYYLNILPQYNSLTSMVFHCIECTVILLLNPLLDIWFLLLHNPKASNSTIHILGYKTLGLLFPRDKFPRCRTDRSMGMQKVWYYLLSTHLQAAVQQCSDHVTVLPLRRDLNPLLWRQKHLLGRDWKYSPLTAFCRLSISDKVLSTSAIFPDFLLLLLDFWSDTLAIPSTLMRETTQMSSRHAPQCQTDTALMINVLMKVHEQYLKWFEAESQKVTRK